MTYVVGTKINLREEAKEVINVTPQPTISYAPGTRLKFVKMFKDLKTSETINVIALSGLVSA